MGRWCLRRCKKQGTDGVSFVKFEYTKDKDLVTGDDHGKKTLLGAEEFVLEDGEYLTAMNGYYHKIYGVEEPIIISLKFNTNKRESVPFGMESGEKFSLVENGHKIVGFHGQTSDVVHSSGVTVVPINSTEWKKISESYMSTSNKIRVYSLYLATFNVFVFLQ